MFVPQCSKCPQCCQCTAGSRSSPGILAEMVPSGRKSESGIHLEGWLHSPVQTQVPSSERPLDYQWLCKSPQEPLPAGGFACSDKEKGYREGKSSDFFQQTVHCPQAKPEMAANFGPQCSKQIFERKNIQNGNSGNYSDLLTTRGMGNIAGFQ